MEQTIPESVLVSERRYFDEEAAGLRDEELVIPPGQIERYRLARPSAMNGPKDALFARLQTLQGKRVLDYGCGTGENSCLLAACGAWVTAFDLSPESVSRARRRAQVHGLAAQIQFDVAAAGQVPYPPGSFDLVCGFNVLHHLHQDLPRVYREVAGLLVPGGTAHFIEPVANSPVLRWMRRLTPVRCHATPDERQLIYSDFEPLRRYFGEVELEHYYLLERLQRVLGDGCRLPLRWVDHHARRLLPLLRRYYGVVVVTARRPRVAAGGPA